MKQFSSTLHSKNNNFNNQYLTSWLKPTPIKKILFLSFTLFFLFSFLTSHGQNTVATNPAVTINQAAAQADPTSISPINFTVQFDQPVTGFTSGDVIISGNTGAVFAVVVGGPTLYNVAVSGMTSCGTVILTIPANVCANALSEPNLASTSTDNTVNYITGNPGVIINQAASQPDPSSVAPINFTAYFAEAVTGFTTGDVTLSGTAGATTAIVTGSASVYNIAVSGMTSSGTVIATIAAGVCQNNCAQFNLASTSTDNIVTINCVPPVVNVTPTVSCGNVPGGSGPCNPLTASGNADTYIWSPIAGLYTNCALTAPYNGTNLSTVYGAPTSNTTYTVTGTITATGCTNSATTLVNYTPPAVAVIPPSVNMCLGDGPVKIKVTRGNILNQFCSGTVNIAVPDNNPAGAFSTINVSGISAACPISYITVTLNMVHTRIGDMVFVLKAPNGQIMNLDYYITGTAGNGPSTGFTNTSISSLGTTPLSAGSNPYTGTFKIDLINVGGLGPAGPTGMLPSATIWSQLFSVPNGTWTLGFYDGITGDVGTLTSWCLSLNSSCPTVPATPAVWTPTYGLYLNQSATVPYIAGTQIDSVWVRPTPAGVYTYQVTAPGVPTTLCTPTTNFTGTNTSSTVTFNIKNNHTFPIILSQIDSKTATAGASNVRAFYKIVATPNNPGPINAANGWNQFASASITGTGTSIQTFMQNLTLAIPAGSVYTICIEALTAANASNLSYSALSSGNYSFNDGGCEITGNNMAFSGGNIPAAPTTPLSGFIGAVHFTSSQSPCTSAPTSVVVTVNAPVTVTTQPVNKIVCSNSSATFTIGVTGTGPFTYQWQISTNGGSTYNNISNTAPFSGINTAALTINPTSLAMNDNLFRVLINGNSACPGATSNAALLTVNGLPTVTITANPLTISAGQTTTIFSTVTPSPAATYTWYYNGSIIPGAAADTLLVTYGFAGDYQLKVTDVNGCGVGVSNTITIANSFALNLVPYPNPSAGKFQVTYYSGTTNAVQRTMIVYNNNGDKIMTKPFTQTSSYQKIDVDVRANGKGIYWVELRDADGKRLALDRVVVQ